MFVSMMLVAGLSLFASHALGGPLYRLEAIGRRLAEGEIPASIRVRRGDDLEGMAAVPDRVAAGLRDALRRARDQAGRARAGVGDLQRGLAAGSVGTADLGLRLQEVADQLQGIQEALRAFRIEGGAAGGQPKPPS